MEWWQTTVVISAGLLKVFNPGEPVTKKAAKSMKVVYTLTAEA